MTPKKRTSVVKSAAERAQKQHFSIKKINPLTKNQDLAFQAYNQGNNLILSGSAGSGKSFLAMYMALNELLTDKSYYNRIIIIRSAVPSRDLGFVPGTLEEKSKIYQDPYIQIVNELVGRGDAWHYLFNENIVQFQTTSFLRGLTFRDCILVFDEIQSATFHEIDTVLTRVGENCRFVLCGDCKQNDLDNRKEKTGFHDAIKILDKIQNVSHVKFGLEDIVRSGFVKEYLEQKEKIGL
jgi:phosphate starvation-inducible protein PhoH